MGDILETKLPIEDGTIPHTCFEPHRRGKNWVAVVVKNLQAPGGLERRFLKKASGRNYVLPTDIKVGDCLEFGGDYYTASGRPSRNREYYRVVGIEPGNPGTLHLYWIDKEDVGKRESPGPEIKPKRFIDLGPHEEQHDDTQKPATGHKEATQTAPGAD